jgi:hypothetical protein
MKRIVSTLALILAVLATSSAFADNTIYRSTMSGPSESLPNNSPGASVATIVIDNVAMTMSLTIPFVDLLAPSTAAHLHCCTAQPLIGTAPPAISFVDFPLGVRDGLYERMFNLSDAGTYDPAFLSAHGGAVATARDFLLAGINANTSYLNIHSSLYPAGEIRGFLVQLAPVPEPSAWLMMGVGLAGLSLYGRRRQR